MEQYIVRYCKHTPVPQDEKMRAKSFPGIEIIDESPKMLLIQSSPETAVALGVSLPDWSVSKQREYTIPNPRPSLF